MKASRERIREKGTQRSKANRSNEPVEKNRSINNVVKPRYRISVRELVEYRGRSGDLDLTYFSGASPLMGMRLHGKIQAARPEEYAAEMRVDTQIDTERFELAIGGRIDGVFEYPDLAIVEEIKTTRKDLKRMNIAPDHAFWAQLKCYGHMYAARKKPDRLLLQLTICNSDTEKTLEIREEFSAEELKTFFDSLVANCIDHLNAMLDWRILRDNSINDLNFPFTDFRPGQRHMAVTVFRVIRDRGQAIVQAPTGIGKTMGVLFPAIKSMPFAHCEKIFYLTARTTGRSAAEAAMERLKDAGQRIKAITITARDKICPHPEKLCHPDECRYARGYYDRINPALESLLKSDLLTMNIVLEQAMEHRVCPFEFCLEASLMADVIICDYNYAFDPTAYLKRFFLTDGKDYAFLVDEAHNLVDRGRKMFSATLNEALFTELATLLEGKSQKLCHQIEKVLRGFKPLKKRCFKHGGSLAEADPPEKLYPLLEKFLRHCESVLIVNHESPHRTDIIAAYFQVSNFLKIAAHFDHTYATCLGLYRDKLQIKLFCMNPASPLKNALKRCSSVIFFSATMTPTAYFEKTLGCDPSPVKTLLPSPFPPGNCLTTVAGFVSTLYKQRSKTQNLVAQLILEMAQARKGNYLAFFPSYQYLQMVLDSFMAQKPELAVIAQTPGMTEEERRMFIEKFSTANENTLVGFAVMGGIFAEGIDLAGERLSGAAIVGVGLPMICVERELIREHFQNTGGDGFSFAYRFPGINRVLQAAGRVIRSESDRGVILLIDHRFTAPQYSNLLPRHWSPILAKSASELKDMMESFWIGCDSEMDVNMTMMEQN